MPVDVTRRVERVEATPRDEGRGPVLRARGPGARRARAERFFADSHGVRPDPILTVGLGNVPGGDLAPWRHSVVVCADPRGAVRS